MLTNCCFYTIQVFRVERREDWQTPAEQSHWLVPKRRCKDCIRKRHLNNCREGGTRRCLDSWMISVLTCSRWRVPSSAWAELRLRHWVHPRSNSRRDNGWNSSCSKSFSWENSSCLIRSSAVTYRKGPISLHYWILITWLLTNFTWPSGSRTNCKTFRITSWWNTCLHARF